jgi:hypothetical protein
MFHRSHEVKKLFSYQSSSSVLMFFTSAIFS